LKNNANRESSSTKVITQEVKSHKKGRPPTEGISSSIYSQSLKKLGRQGTTVMIAMSHVAPGAPVGQTSAALHTVLSQLSFTTDIPAAEEDQSRTPGSVWNGLFCFSFEDDDLDLFFDAQQSLRTNKSDGSVSSFSVLEVRGGDDDDAAASETVAKQDDDEEDEGKDTRLIRSTNMSGFASERVGIFFVFSRGTNTLVGVTHHPPAGPRLSSQSFVINGLLFIHQ
jgi:hypothetical protein